MIESFLKQRKLFSQIKMKLNNFLTGKVKWFLYWFLQKFMLDLNVNF